MLETLELVKKEIIEYEETEKDLEEMISKLKETLETKEGFLKKVKEKLIAYKDQAGKIRGLYQ